MWAMDMLGTVFSASKCGMSRSNSERICCSALRPALVSSKHTAPAITIVLFIIGSEQYVNIHLHTY
jgi:hypothetical protein